jgi:hypothetical protein
MTAVRTPRLGYLEITVGGQVSTVLFDTGSSTLGVASANTAGVAPPCTNTTYPGGGDPACTVGT